MRLVRLYRTLLLLSAVAFVLSAWLYCLATMHARRQMGAASDVGETSALVELFRDHGTVILAAELAALALCGVLWVLGERTRPISQHAPRQPRETRAEQDRQSLTDAQSHPDRKHRRP